MNNKLFPAGLAEGRAFCNRQAEKSQLRNNISNTIHTLILSPRRYGKTSLVLESLRVTKTPHAYIQLFNAFRDPVVIKRFIKGFNGLLTQITPPSKRALQKLSQFITHGKVVLKAQGIEAEFGVEPLAQDPIDIIQGLLKDIEHIVKKHKKQAVIFIDEFQDIVNSDLSNELQSILRDFIQKTDCITFIISGSHRNMLTKLFDDRNKPFYKLFERIILERINAEDYEKFLQAFALDTWKRLLPKEVMNFIFQLTECHAYYFNRLCQKLWSLKQLPSIVEVQHCWQMLVEEEFSSIALELTNLTKNQRIVLQGMAKYIQLKEPAGIIFLNEVGLSHRSVLLAIETLEKIDIIERTKKNGYRIIDPLMKYILQN